MVQTPSPSLYPDVDKILAQQTFETAVEFPQRPTHPYTFANEHELLTAWVLAE